MNNPLSIIYRYIKHFFTARHSKGFGIHSPFIYHFTKFVVYEKNTYYVFQDIEKRREILKLDERIISVTDFGMGNSGDKKVKDIAQRSLKQAKYAQLLFRIVNNYKCNNVIELGTSLGVTTAYIASANEKSQCITLEGCPEIAKIAQENFDALQLKNIDIVVGDINEKLPVVLNKIDKVDLIFIDANHKSTAVLNYFEQCLNRVHDQTIFIVDDIYWSNDMEKAWKMIKKHERVTSTIDLFQFGVVFFNPDLSKKNYKIRF